MVTNMKKKLVFLVQYVYKNNSTNKNKYKKTNTGGMIKTKLFKSN